MSNLGRYQWVTEEASKAGGVDKWLEIIKKAAYKEGASDMKNVLVLPLLATGVGLGAVCVVGGQKIHKWITYKKQEKLITANEAAQAEEYLKAELSDAVDEININEGD